jgi:hypothetical protein
MEKAITEKRFCASALRRVRALHFARFEAFRAR